MKEKKHGDLEVDLMMGKDYQLALIVMTDRKDRVTCWIKITAKNSKIIAYKIIERMISGKGELHTMIFGNGSEFAKHEKVARLLEIKTFFAPHILHRIKEL